MAPEMGTTVIGRMAPAMEAAEPKTLTLEQLNYARVCTQYTPSLVHT